jgi:hypothetical protein
LYPLGPPPPSARDCYDRPAMFVGHHAIGLAGRAIAPIGIVIR